ncbi:hypothetical protein B0H13DRAFT_2326913 [Mycena leptocephala]|nr:hypothetical protein B0H13DRAFT_2326913 [Mycena leptocephala]
MDDEACNGGMLPSPLLPPSSSLLQPPVTASSPTEEDMKDEGLFIQLTLNTMHSELSARKPIAASPSGEDDLLGLDSPWNWASPFHTPLEPTLAITARSCYPSVQTDEETSHNILLQVGRQVVDILAERHGFLPQVVLAVFEASGDFATTDAILREMADAAEAVLRPALRPNAVLFCALHACPCSADSFGAQTAEARTLSPSKSAVSAGGADIPIADATNEQTWRKMRTPPRR